MSCQNKKEHKDKKEKKRRHDDEAFSKTSDEASTSTTSIKLKLSFRNVEKPEAQVDNCMVYLHFAISYSLPFFAKKLFLFNHG